MSDSLPELRPILGFPLYCAGADGLIYIMKRGPTSSYAKKYPRPAGQQTDSGGYFSVNMRPCIGGDYRVHRVHTLINSAFNGAKPPEAECTRHLDGNKKNNLPENLAWGTYVDNEQDKRRHGRLGIGSKHSQAKLTEDAVRILRISIPRGLWNPRDAAKVFGVTRDLIHDIVEGKGWSHVQVNEDNQTTG